MQTRLSLCLLRGLQANPLMNTLHYWTGVRCFLQRMWVIHNFPVSLSCFTVVPSFLMSICPFILTCFLSPLSSKMVLAGPSRVGMWQLQPQACLSLQPRCTSTQSGQTPEHFCTCGQRDPSSNPTGSLLLCMKFESCLTSLRFLFLVCKMRIATCLRVLQRLRGNNKYKVPSTVPGTE